jgi:putative ABC transport system permease protein
MATQTTSVFTLLLGSIAGVSLIVGGIGIMNIMLVSVTERTREIGIRLAIGARDRDILLQFVIEAVVISMLGGVVGIACGLSISLLLHYAFKMTTIVSPLMVIIAPLFSGMVGVFFGFYPARKAAAQNPIDALHYE